MKIEYGIQPNCSEVVYQICGVTQELAEQIKECFIEEMSYKYSEKYLKDFAAGLFAFQTKYHLGLYQYDGSEIIEDFDTIEEIAKRVGLYGAEYVDCCSQPIDTDDKMEEHLKWRKEHEDRDGNTT